MMKLARVRELMIEADNERLSYGEIAEIDAAAKEAGIENTEEASAVDLLIELEGVAGNYQGNQWQCNVCGNVDRLHNPEKCGRCGSKNIALIAGVLPPENDKKDERGIPKAVLSKAEYQKQYYQKVTKQKRNKQ